MSSDLDKAFDAIRYWHGQKSQEPALPNLRHGDRVLDMAGDGSVLYIAGFERNGNEEYHARCLKLGTDKIEIVPVSRLKLSNQQTLH